MIVPVEVLVSLLASIDLSLEHAGSYGVINHTTVTVVMGEEDFYRLMEDVILLNTAEAGSYLRMLHPKYKNEHNPGI